MELPPLSPQRNPPDFQGQYSGVLIFETKVSSVRTTARFCQSFARGDRDATTRYHGYARRSIPDRFESSTNSQSSARMVVTARTSRVGSRGNSHRELLHASQRMKKNEGKICAFNIKSDRGNPKIPARIKNVSYGRLSIASLSMLREESCFGTTRRYYQ